jgi:hypothetical protein
MNSLQIMDEHSNDEFYDFGMYDKFFFFFF